MGRCNRSPVPSFVVMVVMGSPLSSVAIEEVHRLQSMVHKVAPLGVVLRDHAVQIIHVLPRSQFLHTPSFLAAAGLAPHHPELVANESPATTVQDGRTPHYACSVLH